MRVDGRLKVRAAGERGRPVPAGSQDPARPCGQGTAGGPGAAGRRVGPACPSGDAGDEDGPALRGAGCARGRRPPASAHARPDPGALARRQHLRLRPALLPGRTDRRQPGDAAPGAGARVRRRSGGGGRRAPGAPSRSGGRGRPGHPLRNLRALPGRESQSLPPGALRRDASHRRRAAGVSGLAVAPAVPAAGRDGLPYRGLTRAAWRGHPRRRPGPGAPGGHRGGAGNGVDRAPGRPPGPPLRRRAGLRHRRAPRPPRRRPWRGGARGGRRPGGGCGAVAPRAHRRAGGGRGHRVRRGPWRRRRRRRRRRRGESAGASSTVAQAVEAVRPGGTVVVVGIPPDDRVAFGARRRVARA